MQRTSIALGTLALFLMPSLAFAIVDPSEKAWEERPFEDAAAIESACRRATGVTGSESRSLLFLLRRCINNIERQERALVEEAAFLQRRLRVQRLITEQNPNRVRESTLQQNRRASNNIIRRAQQQLYPPNENQALLRHLRTQRRTMMRDLEDATRASARERAALQRKALEFCKENGGSRRATCVREYIEKEQSSGNSIELLQ